jgi:hypothetical protein
MKTLILHLPSFLPSVFRCAFLRRPLGWLCKVLARKANKLLKGMGRRGENAAKQAKRHSLFAASGSLVSSQSTSALKQLEADFDGGWLDDASSPRRDGLLLLHENWWDRMGSSSSFLYIFFLIRFFVLISHWFLY